MVIISKQAGTWRIDLPVLRIIAVEAKELHEGLDLMLTLNGKIENYFLAITRKWLHLFALMIRNKKTPGPDCL